MYQPQKIRHKYANSIAILPTTADLKLEKTFLHSFHDNLFHIKNTSFSICSGSTTSKNHGGIIHFRKYWGREVNIECDIRGAKVYYLDCCSLNINQELDSYMLFWEIKKCDMKQIFVCQVKSCI